MRGRRRDALARAFALLIWEDLAGRIAQFDAAAASVAAELAARRQRLGRPVDFHDTQIRRRSPRPVRIGGHSQRLPLQRSRPRAD
jgi:hypothetical protein